MSTEDIQRELVVYPDPGLVKKCAEITEIDDEIRRIAADMFEIMYESRGVGLAGPQAGFDGRIVTINITSDHENGEELVMLNPVIVDTEGEESGEEGCLSFPGIRARITRPEQIKAEYTNLDGKRVECVVQGFFARVVQHECDHLDGILFTQRMSPTQKFLVKGQLKDLEHEYKASQKKSGK